MRTFSSLFLKKNINRESRGGKGTKKQREQKFFTGGEKISSALYSKTLPLMMSARP